MKKWRTLLLAAAGTTLLCAVSSVLSWLWVELSNLAPAGSRPAGALYSVAQPYDARQATFGAEDIARIAAVRGVGFAFGVRPVRLPISVAAHRVEVAAEFVTADYFAALGVRVRGGRLPRDADVYQGESRECWIADDLGRELYGAQDPLGNSLGLPEGHCTVRGIVPASFRGVRAGTTTRMWLPWADRIGLIVPANADAEFIAHSTGARVMGVVGALDAVELRTAIEARLGTRLRGSIVARGMGLDARQLLASRQQVQILGVAIAGLVVILFAYLLSITLLHIEQQRGAFWTRKALGATQRGVASMAMQRLLMVMLPALFLGTLLSIPASSLLRRTGLVAAGAFDWPQALPWYALLAGGGTAGAVVGACAIVAFAKAWRMYASTQDARMHSGTGGRKHYWLPLFGMAAAAAMLGSVSLYLASAERVLSTRMLHGWERPLYVSMLQPTRSIEEYQTTATRAGDAGPALQAMRQLFVQCRVEAATSAPLATYALTAPVRRGPDDASHATLHLNHVSAGYLGLLGLRDASRASVAVSPSVDRIVLSLAAVRELGDSISAGASIALVGPGTSTPLRVAGIVEDAHYEGPKDRPTPMAYLALADVRRLHVLLSDCPPDHPGWKRVNEIAPQHGFSRPFLPPVALTELVGEHLREEAVRSLVLWTILLLGLLLTGVGTASITIAALNWKLPEYAVRSALGAGTSRQLAALARSVAWPVVAGTAVGLLCWMVLARPMAVQLGHGNGSDQQALLLAPLLVLATLCLSLVPSIVLLRRLPLARLLSDAG